MALGPPPFNKETAFGFPKTAIALASFGNGPNHLIRFLANEKPRLTWPALQSNRACFLLRVSEAPSELGKSLVPERVVFRGQGGVHRRSVLWQRHPADVEGR